MTMMLREQSSRSLTKIENVSDGKAETIKRLHLFNVNCLAAWASPGQSLINLFRLGRNRHSTLYQAPSTIKENASYPRYHEKQ